MAEAATSSLHLAGRLPVSPSTRPLLTASLPSSHELSLKSSESTRDRVFSINFFLSSPSGSCSLVVRRSVIHQAPCPGRCLLSELFGLKKSSRQDRAANGRFPSGRRRIAVQGCRKESEKEPADQLSLPDRWDVLGLGQAMVDFSGMVGDEFLEKLKLQKGTRKVVNHEERGKVLRALDGCSFKASAGGSLSNTLVALARLGSASKNGPALKVAMTGSVGSDPLGDFYRAKLLKADVHFLSPPIVDGTTGTVIVLTTADAQRTMLSYQGMSSVVHFNPSLSALISSSRILVVEGYLWEIPQTVDAIAQACKDAHNNGVLVALTASDISCVTRHRKQFWDLMATCTDILFTNSDEARAICGFSSSVSPSLAARQLSQCCPFVSVTDGAGGSYIGLLGEVSYVTPAPCVPVDTCGAGDAYAAGILYGVLKGVPDLKIIGKLAAKVAAAVVGQQGTRFRQKYALELAESLFTSSPTADRIFEATSICNDIESDKISNV